jgi:hypothetical protein
LLPADLPKEMLSYLGLKGEYSKGKIRTSGMKKEQ